MNYVDGFLLPLPKRNIKAYRALARKTAKIWRDHGALEYRECVGDDIDMKKDMPFTTFPRTMKLKRGETAVLAWIVYRSRAHRDAVNARIMKDPRMARIMKTMKMPFDCRRMAYGGFKILVEA